LSSTFTVPKAASTAVADIVLVRHMLPNARPMKVRQDVGKLLEAEPSAAEFDKIRTELASAGFLSAGPRNTFALTDSGRQRGLRFLGLSELPPRTNWGVVVAKYLFPMAAGLTAESAAKLDTGDRLSAYILKRKYELPSSAGTSVNQVLQAIVCKELGCPAETTLDGLLRAALSKLLGSDERLTKAQLAKQLPLFGTGLSKASAEEARRSLVRSWLAGATAPPPAEKPHADDEPFDLAAFASTVRRLAAGSPPEDRFHDNKVFISAVWRLSQQEPTFPNLSLPEFKQRLVEANSQNLLHLSRADLVQEMDPHLVAASETVHLNAAFHFVLLDEDHP
jgi:hypothetical protein